MNIKRWIKDKVNMAKRGQFKFGNAGKTVGFFVGIVVTFILVANLLPEAQAAGNDINDTGAPFATFFSSDGLVFTLVMLGLFLAAIAAAGFGGRR
jgi:hypothetical protein